MKRNTERKISRRDMIAVVGSGVVVAGTALRAKATPGADTAQPGTPARQAECQSCSIATVKEAKGAKSTVMISDFCCCDGVALVETGYRGAKGTAQKHLKPLYDAMEAKSEHDELLEYCVLVAGITAAQQQRLMEDLTAKFKVRNVPPIKK